MQFQAAALVLNGLLRILNLGDLRVAVRVKGGGGDNQNRRVDEQRKALAVRVESLQTRLYAQYNAMDSLVGRLQKTSESLANQLASLPGFVKKD